MPSQTDTGRWSKKYANKHDARNYLAAVEWQDPEWIPCSMSIFPAVWQKYRDDLKAIVQEHPFVFGERGGIPTNYDHIPLEHQPDIKYKDNWGCGWQTGQGGYEGQVVGHPLDDWAQFETYQPPDPLTKTERGDRHWYGEVIAWAVNAEGGLLKSFNAGRLFDRLYFLRGFENLMKDFASHHPKLPALIQMVQDHSMAILDEAFHHSHEAELRIDQVSFHTDIGTQDRLMISPRQFRQFLKPQFTALFQRCQQEGAHVYLSSDGYLLDIVDDLVESGVSVHDPQERACTIAGIKRTYLKKMCVDLDLDRQVFPFATPDQLKRQVKHAIEELVLPEGGLMLKAEISDKNTPLANIAAILDAFEEYCFLNQ